MHLKVTDHDLALTADEIKVEDCDVMQIAIVCLRNIESELSAPESSDDSEAPMPRARIRNMPHIAFKDMFDK